MYRFSRQLALVRHTSNPVGSVVGRPLFSGYYPAGPASGLFRDARSTNCTADSSCFPGQPSKSRIAIQRRHYHATRKQEVFPLIVAGLLLGGLGRYSYRALQRMNVEWDDYQWALQQYEKQMLKQQQQNATHLQQQKAVAIDLGTVFTKLAATHPAVEVIVTRQGDRAFFNGVLYDKDDGAVVKSVGRSALDKFYFHDHPKDDNNDDNKSASNKNQEEVVLPFTVLATEAAGAQQSKDHRSAQKVVSDVLTPALTEVMDRLDMQSSSSKNASIRKVVTLPCAFLAHSSVYETAFRGNNDNDNGSFSFIPEPVAAVWGAQFHSVLPDHGNNEKEEGKGKAISVLVVDIGGWTTQVAVVRNDVVVHSATIPWGGENVVEQMVQVLKASTHEPLQDTRSLALLQVQARAAVAELSTKTRVAVHVPYLFADPANHHLDTSVARTVLDQAVEAHVRDALTQQEHNMMMPPETLSPHLPQPNDLTSLWTSVLTQVLEQSATLPSNIESVLLVGGGAKLALVPQTLHAALQMIMGPSVVDDHKLKRPDASLQSELTVLGAATILPSFDYSIQDGLVRRDA